MIESEIPAGYELHEPGGGIASFALPIELGEAGMGTGFHPGAMAAKALLAEQRGLAPSGVSAPGPFESRILEKPRFGNVGSSMAMTGVQEVPGMLPTMGELPVSGSGYPYLGPGERGEPAQAAGSYPYLGPGERGEPTVAEVLKGSQVLGAGMGWPLLAGMAIAGIGQLWGGGAGEVMTMAGGEVVKSEIRAGGTAMTTQSMPPVAGPGVPEPPRAMVAKQWNIVSHSNEAGTFRVYFFKLIDGRIMSYNPAQREWKIWRPKKHVVISNNPRMSQIRKLERLYDRTIRKLAKKSRALKLA